MLGLTKLYHTNFWSCLADVNGAPTHISGRNMIEDKY